MLMCLSHVCVDFAQFPCVLLVRLCVKCFETVVKFSVDKEDVFLEDLCTSGDLLISVLR